MQIIDRAKAAVRTLRLRENAVIVWPKQERGWLPAALAVPVPKAPRKLAIEDLAWRTNQKGAQRLDRAYGQNDAARFPDEVRSASYAGDVYAWLAINRLPAVVVEFGSAFGVSGMYWLAGLEAIAAGHLYSFEINPQWAAIAQRNMASIGSRFTLTVGSFEDQVDHVLPGKLIDLAFVDGIHTREFIMRQFDVLRARASKGALVLFDDIDFPTGRMREGWDSIWQHPAVVAACEVNGHLGIVELA